MSSWNVKKLKMKDKHIWKAKPGHKIVVADRGAVRFDIPEAWAVVPDDTNLKLYDKQPPDDDCAITVTIFHLPPMDWSGLPLAKLLNDSIKASEEELKLTSIGKTVQLKRGDLEIVWCEMHFIDPNEKRPAITRMLTARRELVQCLISFDFWVTDSERCVPVWTTILETLTLAQYVSDPTTGR